MQQHFVHVKCVFKKPVLFVAPMRPVANDGVKNMGKVPPDLVRPACFRFNFNQRIPRSRVGVRRHIQLPMCQGFKVGYRLLEGVVIAFQWIVDGAVFIRKSSYNGQVGFFDFAPGKHLLNKRIGVFIQGKQQGP